MGEVLITDHLVHIYPGGKRALDAVSLSIAPGVFGLLGPNGAGKSTLMRVLATLQRPTAGSVSLSGLDVLAHPDQLRRVLGYLPQEFGVYPRISAETLLDHLAMLKGITSRSERRDEVAALLQQVRLWEQRRQPLATLSGGMRRRFGIAQALLGQPRLVIVDEPTAGLDPEERNRCLDLLAGIGEEVVVILSTHIVQDVADLCSRLAVLARGKILAVGAPEDEIGKMRGRIWWVTPDADRLDEIRRDHIVISRRLSGGRAVAHLLADIRPTPDAEPVEPTLEDAYFALLAVGGSQPA